MIKIKLLNLIGIVISGILVICGCCKPGPRLYKMYSEAQLPEDKIAIVYIEPPVILDIVDYTNFERRHGCFKDDRDRIELLPGQHTIWVYYEETEVLKHGYYRKVWSPESFLITFEAQAGHIYEVNYTGGGVWSLDKTWAPYIIDVTFIKKLESKLAFVDQEKTEFQSEETELEKARKEKRLIGAGKTKLTIEEYERILETDPDSLYAHIALGALYGLKKDYLKAKYHLRKSISPSIEETCLTLITNAIELIESIESKKATNDLQQKLLDIGDNILNANLNILFKKCITK